jgi:hypothetical protein
MDESTCSGAAGKAAFSCFFLCLVVSRKTQREERPWFPLPDRFAIISPKSRWDILKHDEDSVRGNATSGSKKFGQLSAERVSFRIRNADAPELKESCSGIITAEYHLGDGYEARHNITLWLVQLRPNDLGCGRQKVISLFLRDIGISLD